MTAHRDSTTANRANDATVACRYRLQGITQCRSDYRGAHENQQTGEALSACPPRAFSAHRQKGTSGPSHADFIHGVRLKVAACSCRVAQNRIMVTFPIKLKG
jgi:hypothetical protein